MQRTLRTGGWRCAEGKPKPLEARLSCQPAGAGLCDKDAGKGRTLDEMIALLVARRNGLDRWITEQMAAGEDLDYLTFLQLISRTTYKIARLIKDRELSRDDTDLVAQLFEGLPNVESAEPEPEA